MKVKELIELLNAYPSEADILVQTDVYSENKYVASQIKNVCVSEVSETGERVVSIALNDGWEDQKIISNVSSLPKKNVKQEANSEQKEESKRIPVILIADDNCCGLDDEKVFQLVTEAYHEEIGYVCDCGTISCEVLAIPYIDKNDKYLKDNLEHDENLMDYEAEATYSLYDKDNDCYINDTDEIIKTLNSKWKLLEIVAKGTGLDDIEDLPTRKSDDHYLEPLNPNWNDESFCRLLEENEDDED